MTHTRLNSRFCPHLPKTHSCHPLSHLSTQRSQPLEPKILRPSLIFLFHPIPNSPQLILQNISRIHFHLPFTPTALAQAPTVFLGEGRERLLASLSASPQCLLYLFSAEEHTLSGSVSSCCNKGPHAWWLKTTQAYPLQSRRLNQCHWAEVKTSVG